MWRVLAIVLALIVGLGISVYVLRKELILLVVTTASKTEIAPNRPITWTPGPAKPQAPAAPRPPQILLKFGEEQGKKDKKTFGGGVAGGRVPTPNIDRLAREGAMFTQAYSGAGSCAPSRAMLMTGRYPTRTGFEFTPTLAGMTRVLAMFMNDRNEGSPLPRVEWNAEHAAKTPPFDEQGLPGSEVTIAELVRAAGYRTAHIGKWHLGRGPEFGPNAQGFDESLLMASGLYLPKDDERGVAAKLDSHPLDRFLWAALQFSASFNGGPFFEPAGYLTDYWTDESLKVIEANRHQPFFLYLAHWGPHIPLQATREDFEAVGDIKPHRLRVYAAMIRALDRSVGRVLDALKAHGLDENTIVVFSSDNGAAAYLGLEDLNAPYRGWKVTHFEGGIRVPLFVRWPAKIPAGTRIDTPVAHIDVMPTLAAAAGAPLPEGVEIDGRNMLVELLDGRKIRGPKDPIFWQSGDYRVVRQGDWKLQVSARQDRMWLYDLANDPTEQVNLAERRPEKLTELKSLIDTHAASGRPALYPYSIASPIPIDKHAEEEIAEGDDYVIWQN